jgi:hypothetical protein
MRARAKKELPLKQGQALVAILKERFEKNMKRHSGVDWSKVEARLRADPEKLWSLNEMEKTGGEPDVIGHDRKSGEYIFFDCSPETPKGRRSVCYDRKALDARKQFKPETSAIDMANAMGVELLTEDEYSALQKLGNFDTVTSSWLNTPEHFRVQGGALFGDRRYGRVFIYQNSAESYYRVRGFRASLRV